MHTYILQIPGHGRFWIELGMPCWPRARCVFRVSHNITPVFFPTQWGDDVADLLSRWIWHQFMFRRYVTCPV